jgi:regulator of RNase E activity RraA
MARALMTPSLLKLLQSVDTPTVCNAIEVAQGKRGFANFTRQTILSSNPEAPALIGYARTAKIAGLEPTTEEPSIIKERRMAYYKYMSEAPEPSIAVIEDTDFPNCIAAYWGEVNSTVHKAFGMKGALTNSVMRDLGDIAEGFTVLAGSIGPSHGFVRVEELATPVKIFGMTVNPDDLVHADRHGGVVIPSDVIDKLEEAIQTLFASEKLIIEPARKPDFDFAEFEKAWSAFEKART